MLVRPSRLVIAAAIILISAAPGADGAAAASDPAVGWVRLAHLSPNTPPVDVYLYPFGSSNTRLVLDHVAYGDASPYESLAPGLYVVAMRAAGAPASTSPIISTDITVATGRAYTVAGLGPASALDLRVLDDQLDAPTGKASVRVIEASLRDPEVSIDAAAASIADNLRFPAVTGYTDLAPGEHDVSVTAAGKTSQNELDFAPNDNYTLAVVDSSDGAPKVLDLTDSAGTDIPPKGGVATGFGGTAGSRPIPGASDTEWAVLMLIGAGGTIYAAKRLRRG